MMWYPTQHSTSPYNHFAILFIYKKFIKSKYLRKPKNLFAKIDLMKYSRVKERMESSLTDWLSGDELSLC